MTNADGHEVRVKNASIAYILYIFLRKKIIQTALFLFKILALKFEPSDK